MSRALIVFGKRPTPGSVKTRLTPALSEEEAASVYRAFLEDAVEELLRLGLDIRLYLTGDAAGDDPIHVAPDVDVCEQQGEELGERMLRAFAETFSAGYRNVVIVGTDHPTLPRSFVEQAFAALEEPRTVTIGPAEDGGYYLLGMNDFRPEIVRGMEYGHASVFEDTLHRIDASKASITVLPPWYDVDTPEVLRRLAAELRGSATGAPRTRAVLTRLGRTHLWLGQEGDRVKS